MDKKHNILVKLWHFLYDLIILTFMSIGVWEGSDWILDTFSIIITMIAVIDLLIMICLLFHKEHSQNQKWRIIYNSINPRSSSFSIIMILYFGYAMLYSDDWFVLFCGALMLLAVGPGVLSFYFETLKKKNSNETGTSAIKSNQKRTPR